MASDADHLAALVESARRELAEADSLQALTEVRARYLGKKGSVAQLLRGLGGVDPSERALLGKAANDAKSAIEAAANERRAALESAQRSRALAGTRIDVTLPSAGTAPGHLHPITLVTTIDRLGAVTKHPLAIVALSDAKFPPSVL